MSSYSPALSPEWAALSAHARSIASIKLNDWFAGDAERAQRLSLTAAGVHLDYSKQRVDDTALSLLLALAEAADVPGWIARMFAGEPINHTEQRAVLHVALRAPQQHQLIVGGHDVMPDVHAVLARMARFARALRDGSWRGASGCTITDVVNIGIGGSDLGPRMVCEALADFADGPRCHFVANVDGDQLHQVLKRLDPQRSLFIITSKTFTTQETMANAGNARAWLVAALGEAAVDKHFVAVSTNTAGVTAFGIHPDNMFGFWDWVGGRYSVWSAVGTSCMVALGPERFAEFLAGAHAMDEHFRSAPLAANLPVLMALLAVWNHDLLGFPSQVVAPYAQKLEHFVGWLQQLEMESNGKAVRRGGEPSALSTTPALWGDVGTNAQHAFFQMLHQSTDVHPVDFIAFAEAAHPYAAQHRMLLANCLAQSAALMRGRTADEVRAELRGRFADDQLEMQVAHRVFSGNRPSNTLLLKRLDPWHLGALMAAYEHRTFVMSLLWDLNAFDQWGVELGKQLAQQVIKALDGDRVPLDASTKQLIARLRSGA